jgi:hypothetical protein
MREKREPAMSVKEIAIMEKSHIGYYGALIGLVVVMNAAMAWWQPNDTATVDGPLPEEKIADIKDMSARCSGFVRSDYRYKEDVNEQRPSINGVVVAEDMRCRQCRGKCKAEDLRCRSQCAGEGACLAHCEERSSKCETMCTQIFQCE